MTRPMTHTQLPRFAALDLHEADILAQLPSLSDWALAPASPLSREVLGDLPAIAARMGTAR